MILVCVATTHPNLAMFVSQTSGIINSMAKPKEKPWQFTRLTSTAQTFKIVGRTANDEIFLGVVVTFPSRADFPPKSLRRRPSIASPPTGRWSSCACEGGGKRPSTNPKERISVRIFSPLFVLFLELLRLPRRQTRNQIRLLNTQKTSHSWKGTFLFDECQTHQGPQGEDVRGVESGQGALEGRLRRPRQVAQELPVV